MVRVSPREESKVFVIGKVIKPVALMLHNDHLSLSEAGGVNPQTGNANQIYMIRDANDKQPTVFPSMRIFRLTDGQAIGGDKTGDIRVGLTRSSSLGAE